jgi:hypothetical protein
MVGLHQEHRFYRHRKQSPHRVLEIPAFWQRWTKMLRGIAGGASGRAKTAAAAAAGSVGSRQLPNVRSALAGLHRIALCDKEAVFR